MAINNFTEKNETLLEIIRSPDREKTFSEPNIKTGKSTATLKNETHKRHSEEQPADRSFPNDIRRGFYIRADHVGHQHIYADSQGKREIFQETHDGLRTKNKDTHAVSLMLDTAAHRGWSNIHVKGTKEFRREAWCEGQARGINVVGYKPTELDLQEMKKREKGYLRNQTTSHGKTATKPDQTEKKKILNEHVHTDKNQVTYHDGIEGIFIEQGQRPYKDNPNKDNSPYIVVQEEKGKQKTIWGVGIPDAILKAGATKGDHIRVREAGMETVTKNILRDINGQTVRVPYQVQRRVWEAEVIKEHVAHQNILQQDEQHNRSNQDKKPHEIIANREVSRTVASQEHSLHVGPGRDVALEDGIYANEARAKAYMAGGRIAAGRMPELKNAAAIEAYIERKIKQKYPHDPVLLQRVMQTARNKIAHAVARGYDFPQPRVVNREEFDKARQNQERNKSQDEKIEKEKSQRQEQNHEHNRTQSRSR